MIESLWWCFALRTGGALIEASPTLLCGLVAAGVLRRMVGPAATRRLFGGPGWKGLVRAWGLGMLLPVCSLGVIPVARELRRAGVPGNKVLAFALIAPLLNPLSFLYGLTLAEPVVICSFAAGTLFVALAVGLTWGRWFGSPAGDALIEADAEAPPAPGPRRLFAVAVTAGRELTGPALAYTLVGAIGTGLLAAALPFGSLQTTMRHVDPLSPLVMALVVTPVYMGPLPGMMRIGLMFEHGNSVGAAFVLLVLGVGVNLGSLAWVARAYGRRAALGWFGLLVTVTLALAYAAEYPLYPAAEAAEHTHAFDDFSRPFPLGDTSEGAAVGPRLAQKLEVLEPVALVGLSLLAVLGLASRAIGRPVVEGSLTRPAPEAAGTPRVWNRPLPGPVLGGLALAVLVALSVISLYVYYPSPRDVFAEMLHVRADAVVAVRTGHREEAIRRIQQWDLLTRKLQVGVYLRTGRLDVDAGRQVDDFRERMEDVRDALLQGRDEDARTLLGEVEKGYQACRRNYLGPLAGPARP